MNYANMKQQGRRIPDTMPFGNGPELWFNMQRNYDFCRERDALRRTGKVKRLDKLPALV